MVRRSRKNKRGGAKIDDIQAQLDNIQAEINELRNANVVEEQVIQEQVIEEPSFKEATIQEEVVSRPWQTDKTIKFKGASNTVGLSFDRIITLLDTNIKKNNPLKEWSTIKDKLKNAKSEDDIKTIIKDINVAKAAPYAP